MDWLEDIGARWESGKSLDGDIPTLVEEVRCLRAEVEHLRRLNVAGAQLYEGVCNARRKLEDWQSAAVQFIGEGYPVHDHTACACRRCKLLNEAKG